MALGKEASFGKEASVGIGKPYKFDKMKAVKVTEDTCVSDYITLHTNATGWMDSPTYAKLVLQEQLDEVLASRPANKKRMRMDDKAPVHVGEWKIEVEGQKEKVLEKLMPGNKNGKEFLLSKKIVPVGVPPNHTMFRPQDQRWCNALFRFQYDKCTNCLCSARRFQIQLNGMFVLAVSIFQGAGDFRDDQQIADKEKVLVSICLTVEWMRAHPEALVAAWSTSNLTTLEMYNREGYTDLSERAQKLLRTDEHAKDLKEYEKHGRMWDRDEALFNQTLERVHIGAEANEDAGSLLEDLAWIPKLEEVEVKIEPQDDAPIFEPALKKPHQLLLDHAMEMLKNIKIQKLKTKLRELQMATGTLQLLQ